MATDYKKLVEEKRLAMLNTLLESMENNPQKWVKGWYAVDVPFNGATNKNYNGLNALFLAVDAEKKGYKDQRWVTFNQAKELGASIKAGEKASDVFYYSKYDKVTKKPFDESVLGGMSDDERITYLKENVSTVLKYYQVFNAEQCDKFPENTRKIEMSEVELQAQNQRIEKIISNSAAPVKYDGKDRAYYSPATDSIHLPQIESFKTMNDYYATALHEIAHSTGHSSRLNRDMGGRFGTESYAIEELRAELTSAFMQSDLGINLGGAEITNHAAYLKSWLSAVKENPDVFYHAAADAGKITKYIKDNYLEKMTVEENTKEVDRLAIAREKAQSFVRETGKPYITIEWTEKANGFPDINDYDVMPLSEADEKFRVLDARALKEEGYYKTKIHIDYMADGELTAYNDCRFDIGGERGGIIHHIEENAKYNTFLTANEKQEIEQIVKQLKAGIKVDKVNQEENTRETQLSAQETAIRREIENSVKNEGKPYVLYTQSEVGFIKSNSYMPIGEAEKLLNELNETFKGKDTFQMGISVCYQKEGVVTWQDEKFTVGAEPNIDKLKIYGYANGQSEAISRAEQAHKKPLVVNFFAGPGAGKTTAALELTAELKKVGYNVEYVSEYAKELVQDKKLDLLANQQHVTDEQFRRLDRLRNSVDLIVTDSPILLGKIYGEGKIDKAYSDKIDGYYKSFDNFNLVVHRGEGYQKEGRLESLSEAKTIDGKITEMLKSMKLYYGDYKHDDIAKTVERIDKTYSRLYGEKENTRENAAAESATQPEVVVAVGSAATAPITAELVSEPKEGRKATAAWVAAQKEKRLTNIEKNVPSAMKDLPNWCAFTSAKNGNGKYTKKIWNCNNADGTKSWAKCNDPTTWATFSKALEYARNNGCDGLSFALTPESGMFCVDLDGCKVNGKYSPLAWGIYNNAKGTYAERSVSGNGLHVFGMKTPSVDFTALGNKSADGALEFYDRDRFMSLTGDIFMKSTSELKTFSETDKLLVATKEQLPVKTAIKPVSMYHNNESDSAVIERIRNSKKGAEFDRLYAGEDICGDLSRSDYKMLNILAFFTNGDAEQMKRIFEQSGLMRADKSKGYLDRSINHAIGTLYDTPKNIGSNPKPVPSNGTQLKLF